MAILLPSEKGDQLTEAEGEALFAFWRASVSVTISSDTLTVPGSGRYKVLPQSGTSDQITSIALSAENVEGALIQLRPQTTGHTITLVHGASLRLAGGINVELTTPYSSVWLRYHASSVWAQEGAATYVP